jgi:hypothetical protein
MVNLDDSAIASLLSGLYVEANRIVIEIRPFPN